MNQEVSDKSKISRPNTRVLAKFAACIQDLGTTQELRYYPLAGSRISMEAIEICPVGGCKRMFKFAVNGRGTRFVATIKPPGFLRPLPRTRYTTVRVPGKLRSTIHCSAIIGSSARWSCVQVISSLDSSHSIIYG